MLNLVLQPYLAADKVLLPNFFNIKQQLKYLKSNKFKTDVPEAINTL